MAGASSQRSPLGLDNRTGCAPVHKSLQQPENTRLGKKSDVHSGMSRKLHEHGVADQPHRETFNFKGLTRLYDDGLVVRVFRV